MDAVGDAAIDAPAGPASRIWFDGDYITDGVTVAGSFGDGVALPVVPPAVASSLGTNCSFFVHDCFDATPTKIAFAANPSDPSQAELYIADVDGQNARRLVATQPGVDVRGVALSPDATKIAFSMDSTAQDGSYDVWIVDTTGSGTPVRVSPDYLMEDIPRIRAPGLTWSADSRYLGFAGLFTYSAGAYVTDTAQPVPTTAALFSDAELQSGYYVLSLVEFDASDHVYVRSYPTEQVPALFIADPDGQNRHVLAMPQRGDGTTGTSGATTISPDGKTIVFACDAPTNGTFELYTSATAVWNPVPVTTGSPTGTGYAVGLDFHFSPDASAIIFEVGTRASFGIDRINLDGTQRAHLLAFTSGQNPYQLSDWTLDGRGIYMSADMDGSGHTTLYRLDTHSVNQTAELAVAPPSGGDVFNVLIRPM